MRYLCRDATDDDLPFIYRINAESLPGVSQLDAPYVTNLRRCCVHFRVIEIEGKVAGYLFAMLSNAKYDGEEFQWFTKHFDDAFFYIDQIAVAKIHRGLSLGRQLYDDLLQHAQRKKIRHLTCEINVVPPNEASLAFHKRLGFTEVSRLQTRYVTVSLQVRSVAVG